MNWEEVGAIGQVLGSIAVFVTLVYLSIQTRHSKEATQRAVSQGRAEWLRNGLTWGAEARMAGIIVKANSNLNLPIADTFMAMLVEKARLSHEEALSLWNYQMSSWQYRLRTIAAIDDLPSIERNEFDTTLVRMYGSGSSIAWMFYQYMKPTAAPDAMRYIDNLLAHRR